MSTLMTDDHLISAAISVIEAEHEAHNRVNGHTQEALNTDGEPGSSSKPLVTIGSNGLLKKNRMSSPQPAAMNSNASPPTPTVKKIINSGTFGVGSVKPSAAKPVGPLNPPASKVSAPPLKKASTSAPAATTKPSLASSVSSKPANPTPVTGPARRASLAPSKTIGLTTTKPLLSASTNGKAAEANVGRSSVASPTGSSASSKVPAATRPRASVSEAVKKTPISSRPSLTPTTKSTIAPVKPNVARSSAAPPPSRSSRPAGSISSIRELKEIKDTKSNGKATSDAALSELQAQLEESSTTLESKNASLLALEETLESLKLALAKANEEAASQSTTISDLEKAKDLAEAQLVEAERSSGDLEKSLKDANDAAQLAAKALDDSRDSLSRQTETIHGLEKQIGELEKALSTSKEKIENLENAAAVAAASADAISRERNTLIKIKEAHDVLCKDVEAMKHSNSEDSAKYKSHVAELEAQVSELTANLKRLQTDKEESANKQSELEIEILELKESQESLEDSRESLQKRIANLEDELANAAVASALSTEAIKKKEEEVAQKFVALAEEHGRALNVEVDRYRLLSGSLDLIKAELDKALAAHEQTKKELLATEQSYQRKLLEQGEAHAVEKGTLVVEVERVAAELADQESIYNSKVKILEEEHAGLLEEAFKRAKDEAGAVHSQELQNLRSSSSSTIEQIQAAHRNAITELKGEHASILESEIGGMTKQINKLTVELKATQDDLAKTKATLDAAKREEESLIKQRDEARAQADAIPELSPEHADTIARLTTSLSNAQDDLMAANEMLNLTKSTMTEMSDNHTKELEDNAKSRAAEITKLRAEHDTEVTTLVNQKSELMVRLSDLEGELSTVRANLEAHQTALPRSNGNGASQPASPSVTKEELSKLHEAHTLKIYDLQAEHEKALKEVKLELQAATDQISDLQQDIGRKAMEIQYLEQDQEDNQESIARLQEELKEAKAAGAPGTA